MRADHLSCYSYKKKTSPNIDIISKDSLLFENAISQSNWTYPSLYSLISSKYPSAHRITWFDQIINNGFITLPEILQRYGYHTAIFSNFKILINPETFGKHFKETKLADISENTLKFIANWLGRYQRSFFIFHIGDYVHEPYYADKKYVDMFYEDGYEDLRFDDIVNSLTSTSMRDSVDKLKEINRKLNLRIKRLSKKQLAYIMACYDAGIYYVDSFIGKFYEIIQKKLKNYLFIVTADHGQCFFEHGFHGHGLHLYNEVVRVPLIVNINNNKNIGKIEEPVQHIDLYPTILELLGLGNEIKNLDGTSFIPLLSQKRMRENNRFAISESHPFISIRNGNHKLITTYFRLMENNGLLKELYLNCKNKNMRRLLFNCYALLSSDKFYDLRNDPNEQNNIKWKNKITYKQLFMKLKAVLSNANHEGKNPTTLSLDEEIKRQLGGLGYM
jgi:arylsulfatase A-like enzyme